MKAVSITIVACWVILLSSEIDCRMCYSCDGNGCSTNVGSEVDCRNELCGMDFDISGTDVPAGTVKRRYCAERWDRKIEEQYCSLTYYLPGGKVEDCVCDEDLCNGKETGCQGRAVHDSEISKLLAGKCDAEITEYKRQKEIEDRDIEWI